MDAGSDGRMFAAVDLGSNSFHLLVARSEHGQLVVIDRMREMVRLAAGLDEDGNLATDACERALECIARFGQRVGGISSDNVRAVATNTLRQAKKPRIFLTAAEYHLGHPIEIISGQEEARLVYLGVAHSLASDGGRRLVVDVGGGSTELALGCGDTLTELESLAFGCVGITQQFFADGKVSRSRFKAAQTAVALEIRPVRERFHQAGWDQVVGTSGTVRAAGTALADTGWSDGSITRQGLKKLRRALEDAGHASRIDLPGVTEQRRPVFAAGVAILLACFRNLDIDTMVVSDAALREGALYDLIGRKQHLDPREASVSSLAARYRVDAAQAARVRATALIAFDQVASPWHLGDEDRQRLDWAARLHEIGLAISHEHHHRHGAYLAQHSALPGFSSEEQLVLATLVLTHRRRVAADAFGPLPERLLVSIKRVCALLRLGALLHRSRVADALPPVHWTADGDTLGIAFPAGWLDQHPLTRADLEAESKQLRRLGVSLVVGGAPADVRAVTGAG